MNILFTSDLSGMGGGETSLFNLCVELKDTNKIVVLCASAGKLVTLLKNAGIKTYTIDYRSKTRLIPHLIKIREIVQEEHIQVIHSNDPLTSVIMRIAVLGKKINNYWTCHGQWYAFSYIKRQLIIHSNKHVFCVSTKVYKSLQSMGFSNIQTTYLGIPLQIYQQASPSNLRQEYSIGNQSVLLGCIGRFQPIKGQMKLAEAVKNLIQQGYDIVCLFVGGCIFNDPDEEKYYNKLCNFVQENGLGNRIKMVGERRDVPRILKELDALIIPSDNESFGMVAIEALAAGTPVLSTPNDGVSEILNYDRRYLSETNDARGLEKLIAQFLTQEDMQAGARSFCEARKKDFAIDIVAEKYKLVFEKGIHDA